MDIWVFVLGGKLGGDMSSYVVQQDAEYRPDPGKPLHRILHTSCRRIKQGDASLITPTDDRNLPPHAGAALRLRRTGPSRVSRGRSLTAGLGQLRTGVREGSTSAWVDASRGEEHRYLKRRLWARSLVRFLSWIGSAF